VDKSDGYLLGNPQAGYADLFNPRQRVS